MIFLLSLIYCSMSYGSFSLPQNLNVTDRQQAIDILGLGTTSKFLSNAYPLGGYSGLEVSVSGESFDVKNIKTLGNGTSGADSVLYPKFTIGKGLFNNSDIFINFVPFSQAAKISRYGLQYRISLYRADFFPINFSVVGHANSANINNQLFTRTLGADLLVGTMINDFSFTISGGYVDSSGDFIGGTNGVTDTLQSERASTESMHIGMSATYMWQSFLIGLSIDRYKDPVVNFKLGLIL